MNTSSIMRGDWLFYKGRFNAFPFKVEQVTKKKIGYHVTPCCVDIQLKYKLI